MEREILDLLAAADALDQDVRTADEDVDPLDERCGHASPRKEPQTHHVDELNKHGCLEHEEQKLRPRGQAKPVRLEAPYERDVAGDQRKPDEDETQSGEPSRSRRGRREEPLDRRRRAEAGAEHGEGGERGSAHGGTVSLGSRAAHGM
jgi:hypothetical protein